MILSKQNGSFIFYLHAHQLLFERCIKKNCLTQINLIGDEKKSSGSAAPEAHQFLESFLEVLVGHGVDDRVNEGVQVSQPGEEVEQLLVETRDTRGHQQGVDEKREPANDVSAEDDPQSLGGFPFPGRGDALFFQERVGDGHFHLVVARGRAGVAGRGVVPPALQGGGGRHRPGGVGDQVRGGESLPDLPRGLFQDAFARLHVNPPVEDDQQQGGDVESSEGGVDGVKNVVRVDAAAGQLLRLHLPPEKRRQGDGDRDHPRRGHHARRARRRALFGVLHRVRDGPVPIQCDDAQVEDRCGAASDVGGQPDVADDLPQRPGVDDRVEDADGHHQDGHQ